MKKSDRKALQDLLNKDTRPRSPKTSDLSDDLSRQFDDGTGLPSARPTPGTGGTSSTGGTPGTGTPVAPARDFMKVANSIHREAAPAGVFRGKGKLIYDYLYSRTRGAIVPTRTVQASWREIMRAASIGSDKTLREQLKLLRAAGLITWEWSEGSQGGSVYTVYLPEETTGTPGTPSTSGQNLPPVLPAESTAGTSSLNLSFQRASEIPNTLLKTKTEKLDDEAFTGLRFAATQVTGREATDWRELDEVLTTEFKIAAARTDVISNAPAFFAEHLRRRLFKKDKAKLESEENASPAPRGPQIDASKCPDCGGSGYFYPEGYDKGVKRCDHQAGK